VSVRTPAVRSSRLRGPQGSAGRDSVAHGRCHRGGFRQSRVLGETWTDSPVAKGKAAYTGASRSPRTIRPAENNLMGHHGRAAICQLAGVGWPHDVARTGRRRRIGPIALVSTSVGVVRIGGGEQAVPGCQTGVPARYRFPPPDSGVVPFSEARPSPIKSDRSNLWPRRMNVRKRRHASIVPLYRGGGTTSSSDRAYGIS